MTTTSQDAAAHVVEPAGFPRIREIVARVAISMMTAVVAPAVLFAATLVVFNLGTAMIVALAWVGIAIAWRSRTGREVSGLLLLTGVIMVVKTAITFATGNAFIYFVQPVVVDVVVAAVFIGSLWSARPLVARLAPDFCPLAAEITGRPGICRLYKSLTLMWGLVILVKGGVTMWLLLSLSTVNFVLIKSGAIMSLTVLTVAVTVAWAAVVCRREGLLGLVRADAAS